MKKEEFDTSELAWLTYKLFYGTNFKIDADSSGRKNSKLYIDDMEITVSGDTDFNFGKGWSNSILNKYKGYLGNVTNEYKKLYENQLNKCNVLYKTIVNISLMPQTGSLQLVKSGIGNDRFDTYIWALNSYYERETSLLFNRATFQNTKILKEYFAKFEIDNEDVDYIHQYCFRIYGIPATSQLVDELISSGKEAIDSPERVIEYMQLAYKFWLHKLKFLKKMLEKNREMKNLTDNESKTISSELDKIQKELDNWFE